MATLTFDRWSTPPIIEIAAPATTITVQEIITKLREYEARPENSDMPPMIFATGKQPLGGVKVTGLTWQILTDWRIQFEARAGPAVVQCFITDGNTVPLNGDAVPVTAPTAFTHVITEQDTSAGLVKSDSIIDLLEAIFATQ